MSQVCKSRTKKHSAFRCSTFRFDLPKGIAALRDTPSSLYERFSRVTLLSATAAIRGNVRCAHDFRFSCLHKGPHISQPACLASRRFAVALVVGFARYIASCLSCPHHVFNPSLFPSFPLSLLRVALAIKVGAHLAPENFLIDLPASCAPCSTCDSSSSLLISSPLPRARYRSHDGIAHYSTVVASIFIVAAVVGAHNTGSFIDSDRIDQSVNQIDMKNNIMNCVG